MNPIDEALKRWWQWKHGYNKEVPTVAEMWDDLSFWRERDGSLTYKQALYERLQEVADEQHEIVEKAQDIGSVEYEILCGAILSGLKDGEVKTKLLSKVQSLRDAVLSEGEKSGG